MRYVRKVVLGWAIVVAAAGCDDEKKLEAPGGAARYALVSNLEKSAFVGTWNGVRPSSYANANAFEVGVYAYLYTRGRSAFVPQNTSSDDVLRFDARPDGTLALAGKLTAPPRSNPQAIAFASPNKAYVSCLDAGKVLAFDPTTMQVLATIDFTGPQYAVSEPGAGDINPDPGALGIRDGKLYVALAQKNTTVTSHPGMSMATVDIATDTILTSFHADRFAESGGEIDRVFLDEQGDLYVYGGASYGFAPGQSNGFLRIKRGEGAFDPAYGFDVGAMALDVPGGRIDYLNHMIYAGNGVAYAAANVPGLASNPPDFANDHTFQVVEVDLHRQTVRLLPLPRSNGYSGALAFDGSTLLAALAAREGVGIFTYDLATSAASTSPVVATEGFVSQLAPVE